jgi:hypothetical protein
MRDLALFLALCASGSAHAYEMRPASHSGGTHTLYAQRVLSVLMPSHYAMLQNAESKVNANVSALRFSMSRDDDYSVGTSNGESEVWMTVGADTLCSSIACTIIRTDGRGNFVETDVIFELMFEWALTDNKTDSVSYNISKRRPLLNTAIHEFGHSLGLKHESGHFQVMGNAWNVVSTNGPLTESVISEDSSEGLVSVYGTRSASLEDLSLYHWKRTGESEGYSNHGRVAIYTGSGTELAAVAAMDEPTYKVNAGDSIIVEMTAENRGQSRQTVSLGIYLSTNDTITTNDILLDNRYIVLSRDSPWTFKDTGVDLPDCLASGSSWWIGAIIDNDGSLSEQNEINNAVYFAELQVR